MFVFAHFENIYRRHCYRVNSFYIFISKHSKYTTQICENCAIKDTPSCYLLSFHLYFKNRCNTVLAWGIYFGIKICLPKNVNNRITTLLIVRIYTEVTKQMLRVFNNPPHFFCMGSNVHANFEQGAANNEFLTNLSVNFILYLQSKSIILGYISPNFTICYLSKYRLLGDKGQCRSKGISLYRTLERRTIAACLVFPNI